MALNYFIRPSFWGLLFVGWLIAACAFSLVVRLFGHFEELSQRELWIVGVSIHVLALLAGFSFARSKTRSI